MQVSQALTDDRLVAAVADAVSHSVSAAAIERYVGAPAALNTTRPGDRAKLPYADVDRDPDRGNPVPQMTKAADVVYWQRPGSWHDPHLVGVMWDAEGRPKIFFGVLLPP